MHTAEIRFVKKRKPRDEYEHTEAILHLLMALKWNGQISDRDETTTQVPGGYLATVSVPEPRALHASLHSADMRQQIRALPKAGLGPPRARLIGHQPDSEPVCQCRSRSTMLLQTDMLSLESPVRCGDCRGVIPLYRLPYTGGLRTYENIRWWSQTYRLFDRIWIGSGVGEKLAYRELTRHDSNLSTHGRNICANLREATGRPTYYYLHRYYGRSQAAERKRKCPNCGHNWLLDVPWMERYEFKCDRCCLVSEIANEVA